MLSRFSDFKTEYLLESILLESKLTFSDKLKNLISNMPDSKIKVELLKASSSDKDLTLTQNYFDIHPEKDKINFIQDRKAQEILGTEDIKWQVNETHRRLTLNKDSDGEYKNKSIFDELGFDPETMGYQKPSQGQVGDILAETPSKETAGKIYVLFKFDDNQYSIYDKSALSPKDERLDKIWQLTKNPINVGRGIRSILKAANISFTDRELEEFVNSYKSSFDILNDAFLKFDIVSGKDIAHWYSSSTYQSRKSTLGNSCMANMDSETFDIYVYNPKVCSLVILYSDKGKLENGKWKSDKIRGRALLWKTDEGMFLDRIYTNEDEDVNLFIQFANENGWWHKKYQDSNENFTAVKDTQEQKFYLTIELDYADFDMYPYVDTFCYLCMPEKYLTNLIENTDDMQKGMYELRGTNGDYSEQIS